MRVLFMGTPAIAATCLSAVAASEHTVVGVICQPDKPVGRRYVLTPPPVKVKATELGLPVYQPEALKDGAILPLLEELRPDVCLVVAYGRILPSYVLNYPRYGCLNLHVSLLPGYRGAAPMQRAIMAGERETGVTVMYMDAGLDTGDILSVHRFPIGPADDLGTVEATSGAIGGPALLDALRMLEEGSAPRIPQPCEGVSYAAKIQKEDQLLDFSASSAAVLAAVGGLSPAPLATPHTPDGKMLKVLAAAPGEGADPYGVYAAPCELAAPVGTVVSLSDKGEGGITVKTADGTVVLTRVLPEGKGAMRASDFIRGRRIAVGDLLS